MSVWRTGRKNIRSACFRIYSDFFMPSRLAVYEQMLQEALEQGYEVHSVASFWEVVKAGGPVTGKRYLILRHDVDTDVKTARMMWRIESKWKVKASYYFRLSTLDVPFMQEICRSGSEASYHYEEIATIGKRRGLVTREQIQEMLPLIRREFARNVQNIREWTGLPIHTVASHGDFYNRKLEVINYEILKDRGLRDELGIELETYDDEMMKHVTARHSDTLAPLFWKPLDPLLSLRNRESVVYVLTHPRHWRTDVLGNAWDNAKRLWEEIRYQYHKRAAGMKIRHRLCIPMLWEVEWADPPKLMAAVL